MADFGIVNLVDPADNLPTGFGKINTNFQSLENSANGFGASMIVIESIAELPGATEVQGALEALTTINATTVTSTNTFNDARLITTDGLDRGIKELPITTDDSGSLFNVNQLNVSDIVTTNPITVPYGGTGRNDADAFSVLCGGTTATGAHQSVSSVGTSGQVLTSGGADALPTWETPTGSTTAAMSSGTVLEYEYIGGISLPTNSGSVRIHSFADCLIKFDTDTEYLYFAQGTEILGVPTGAISISVIGFGKPGIVNIVGLDSEYKYKLNTTKVISYTAGSKSVELPSGSSKLRLFAMTDCFINFGSSSVSADSSSLFFEAGTEIINIPSATTHIAVQRYTEDGGLYISGIV